MIRPLSAMALATSPISSGVARTSYWPMAAWASDGRRWA